VLEEQLRELELLSIQTEPSQESLLPLSARAERRKSFRPASARPRTTTLMASLAEDHEVHPATTAPFQELGVLQRSVTLASLVLDVTASCFDDQFPPASVLSADHASFWMTSGMFPQTLRFTLREPVAVREVEVTCRYVRRLQIRTAPSRTNAKKMAVDEAELSASESSQRTTHCFAIRRHGDKSDLVEVIEVGVESASNDFALVYVVRFRRAEPDASENG
jgi:hypothetical protein